MSSRLWRRFVLPFGDVLARQTVMKHLEYYEKTQYWPAERIQHEQDRLVCETVAAAYEKCSFYRDLYGRAGVKPTDIRGAEDLYRLPVVDKVMLRSGYPNGVTIPTSQHCREYSTSGSTGRPFRVLLDDDTMSRARALMLLRTLYTGWKFGDRIFQTGMAVERGFLKSVKDRILQVTYRSAFDLSDEVLDEYLEIIDDLGIEFVCGYAQSIYLLANRACASNRQRTLRAVVTWGSNLLPQFRESIRSAFGCATYDSYGVGEGMQIAAQSIHSGEYMHQFSLHVAAEIVCDGAPVEVGQRGEILLTRLNPGAMPLIRYRIGDVGRAAIFTGDTGGINLPLWAGVDGRVSDIIQTPAGNQLIVEFFFGIFQNAHTIALFQVVQRSLDTLQVQIVVTPDFSMADWEQVAAEIRSKGDPDLNLDVEVVSSIPLEKSGKRRFIVSHLEM